MQTDHKIIFSDSRNLSQIPDGSVDLVVTSPPYPMIAMWDDLFCSLNPKIKNALGSCDGMTAFELMNCELDCVWKELSRVVKTSGFVCINIGDATRSIGSQFQLFSNHSRITAAFSSLGFVTLPIVLWKKTTNAPNKFMGSGMLPAGAYITLEHEYILVFRKGGKREFTTQDQKRNRNDSALFWEERNTWFSDTWDLKGVRQHIGKEKVRERNAAFPFELPYRIINMYSAKGDLVLDPFLGTGTTTFAAIASGRNSIGVEYDKHFNDLIKPGLEKTEELANSTITQRITNHIAFVKKYQKSKNPLKYMNKVHGFPVMTKQEQLLTLNTVSRINVADFKAISAEYDDVSPLRHDLESNLAVHTVSKGRTRDSLRNEAQMNLFE